MVETLGFSGLLNLENDTDFYTSHSSIFLGLIRDIFGSLRPLAPISSILADFVNFGRFRAVVETFLCASCVNLIYDTDSIPATAVFF